MAVTSDLDRVKQALAGCGHASSDYDLNPGVDLPKGRSLRPAAVLVPIIETDHGARVILTKRSARLKHHPGQVAFPGGGIDDTDTDAAAAALRESHEEIGLEPGNVEILGQLPAHETVTSYSVTPFVGRIRAPFTPVAEASEVAEVFTVPLPFLLTPASYRVERRRWRGAWRSYYVAPYGPYYIWGATARILKGLADRVAP
ncbi:MAG: CoA pyrophosphatase [Rhodobacteraceae bacterium CG17_big_fil_post_rev_8_21_14_2_50_65_11]|nr:MAG: CoA pyrophosphatase [Rhodobacteraceae bacterium CG17_big_fil_post_rev_8_21_14_2_50_65_11]